MGFGANASSLGPFVECSETGSAGHQAAPQDCALAPETAEVAPKLHSFVVKKQQGKLGNLPPVRADSYAIQAM
jgi:hypothetical protein